MKQQMLRTRDMYINAIREELLGPGSEISIPDAEHELISSSPDGRYSIGILFPYNSHMGTDNDEVASHNEMSATDDTNDEEDEDGSESAEIPNGLSLETSSTAEEDEYEDENDMDDDSMEEEVSLSSQNKPSSMGISFLACGNTDIVHCKVSFATYRRALAGDCRVYLNVQRPENVHIPASLSEYAYFDVEDSSLKLHKSGFKKKDISSAKLTHQTSEDDECDIFAPLYAIYNQVTFGYVREPHTADVVLDFSSDDYAEIESHIDNTTAKLTGLRRKYHDGIWSITVMLINDISEAGGDKKDKTAQINPCLFQPEIRISSQDNQFSFQQYGGALDFSLLDFEEQSLELQYRNKKVYATGLGTAANWTEHDQLVEIYTDYFPEREIPGMDFGVPSDCNISAKALSMKYLSDLTHVSREQKCIELQTVIDGYSNWIAKKEKEISGLDPVYCEVAVQNLNGCKKSCLRMSEGLDILRNNDNAWSAFQLANRAMFMQRAHLSLQATTSQIDRFPEDNELQALLDRIEDDGYECVDSFIQDYYSWRLFQIAFLLMSINSITNDESIDRSLVDLIWFPTGGGKTEAYLGLTAMTIFYRRLQYPSQSCGTTVMMRYTLRLLTAQQFTRASTLICACEYIRQDAIQKHPRYGRYALGKEPITIGLWIGNDHTPGKIADAKTKVKKLHDANYSNLQYRKDKYNKFQVLKCPWCGTKLVKEKKNGKLIGTWGYVISGSHFEIHCPQERCFFNSEGRLPIQIIDEELYNNPPTLLFGTVDKFAMLPWNKEIGRFFGIKSSNRAPELIIQDELHLISGPLGTMVGLYESAIDLLCKEKGSTKIIASTATIRRAREQCAALYNREVAQFPHPALDAEDSFFARESIIDHDKGIFGRKYIGLMPSGKTKAMMEVRTMAALLQRMQMMNLPDQIKDSYWTLTAYFNSLKELGKCSTLLEDDVKDSIKRTARRFGQLRNARLITTADELTSRVTTTKLNETLDKLEKLNYSKENIENKRYASNVLLATNMISVGIDIARLNVMLMIGQPKLTSEYIQASSRVGRRDPGVVFTLYDGVRSRDRSHYEQFISYHDSYYKHVEPTGATPFSKPARDRALHSIVIALLRILEPSLSDEKSASVFSLSDFSERISAIKADLLKRNANISESISPDATDETEIISEEIDAILEQWEHFAEDGEPLYYGERFMVQSPLNGERRLLKVYNTKTCTGENPFNTMTSMRSVDASIRGTVRIWEDD